MFKMLRGLLAFMTLRLMLLPLTLVILYAVGCFIWFKPAETPAAAGQPADGAQVVPAAHSTEGPGPQAEPLGFSEGMRNFAAGWRVLIWLGVVGLLPFGAGAVVQRALQHDSNAASGGLLIGLTALGILLCLFLMGFRLNGGWEITLLVVAAVLAAVYNFVACEWLAERG
jgi:hypothetical protein